MTKTSAEPFRHPLSTKCTAMAVAYDLKSIMANSYAINAETMIVEDASHSSDVDMADQVAARFTPFIRSVQLGKPTSGITAMRGR